MLLRDAYRNSVFTHIVGVAATLFTFTVNGSSLFEYELSGKLSAEYRYFLSEGDQGQKQSQPSILAQPEMYWTLSDEEGDASFTFVPFYRYDNLDSERTHADIREMLYLNAWSDYEFRFGIGKVFWGVTESTHLVDVINQTDLIESVDGEDKLGQPMWTFSMFKDWGTTEVYYLPYFRERTFPGKDGRLRTGYVVNTDKPRFESSDKEKHADFALRYSQMFGDWDIGVSYLQGTDREPTLLVEGTDLIPYYAQMKHTGLDVQGVVGDWLWKLEAIYKDSYENYTASVAGFEYTWVGAFGRVWDLGIISEYLYDSREADSNAIGQNDIFGGLRLAFNDEDSSEILIGMTQDIDESDIRIYRIEASTRLSNQFSLRMEAWGMTNDIATDPLYSLRKDDFVEMAVDFYF
ncbi:hypothetical protein [Vibrio sp. HN007]|uniref:hypothetical protein n=1 Tax=Vibrio iocasae TaxID=3098914 RepID=UPI0035D4257A